MSSMKFELIAATRKVVGKLGCKRLRLKENQIPAIVYGGKATNWMISLDHNQILKVVEQENFYSQILNLQLDGNLQKVVLKDLQRHPFKPKILHLDFQRVTETDIVNIKVPLHFLGADKCPGVKLGGIINHYANTVEVKCEARYLPEFVEVDLAELNLGEVIHLSNLKLPQFVEVLALTQGKLDSPVVGVQIMKDIAESESMSAASLTSAISDKEAKEKDNKDKAKTASSSANTKSSTGSKSDKK